MADVIDLKSHRQERDGARKEAMRSNRTSRERLRRIYDALLSPPVIGGAIVLGAACFIDQALGGATSQFFQRTEYPKTRWGLSLMYLALLGLSPVTTGAGLVVAAWLAKAGRHRASTALATASLVAVLFAARSFAVADKIGWHAALIETLIAGRTIAATTVAIVLAEVLRREKMVNVVTAAIVGVGFPVVIGSSRIALGVYPISDVLRQWLIGALMGAGILWPYIARIDVAPQLDE